MNIVKKYFTAYSLLHYYYAFLYDACFKGVHQTCDREANDKADEENYTSRPSRSLFYLFLCRCERVIERCANAACRNKINERCGQVTDHQI